MSTVKRKRRKTRGLLLSSTRPHQLRSAKSFHPLPSSSAGRTLIRTHHTLHKRLTAAVAHHDVTTADAIRAEIESLGGLERYQDASLAGQSKERGGDTSAVLVQWLSPHSERLSELKILEVGALSVDNACSRSKFFGGGVERIDLNSRHPGIREQNFMERPLPEGKADLFDVVSLSLVVNYVADPKSRGEMLERVASFLWSTSSTKRRSDQFENEEDCRISGGSRWSRSEEEEDLLPALFLVLPAPCVHNSRYLDEERLKAMMETLGYSLVRRKMSSKLIYYLWKHHDLNGGDAAGKTRSIFKKKEIRKGKGRNNFAIMLQHDSENTQVKDFDVLQLHHGPTPQKTNTISQPSHQQSDSDNSKLEIRSDDKRS